VCCLNGAARYNLNSTRCSQARERALIPFLIERKGAVRCQREIGSRICSPMGLYGFKLDFDLVNRKLASPQRYQGHRVRYVHPCDTTVWCSAKNKSPRYYSIDFPITLEAQFYIRLSSASLQLRNLKFKGHLFHCLLHPVHRSCRHAIC
jgi:hypothetical protein